MSKLHLSVPLALACALAAVSPLHAGPPWVSIEYPANPHDPLTRDALAVVHTYHHGDALAFQVTARAIGLVRGARTDMPLEVVPTTRRGVYAVRGELPDDGSWVVVVSTREGEHGGGARATALVALGASRELLTVRVPYEVHEGRWHVPRDPTEREVEDLLRTAVAMSAAGRAAEARAEAAAPRETSRLPAGTLPALLLLALPSGALWLRGRARHGGH